MYLEKLVIDNIRRIRKEKGVSQEKLAEACGTSTSYIGLMEIYRNVPKLSTIEKIAAALNVDPLVLFSSPEQQRDTVQSGEKNDALKNRLMKAIGAELDAILHETVHS